jgi:L-asparaginase II/putative methionine-R-sulfoxide reductase with GAF domain
MKATPSHRPLPDGEPLVGATRGEIVESVHRVAACAIDRAGEMVFSIGTIDVATYLRSTAKPFIAAAAVREGVVERFGLEPREIAVMAASHNAQPFHLEAVRSILRKINVSEEAFACGAHAPYDPASAAALTREGIAFAPIHNNCSGKHAGILALCRVLGADTASYLDANNPAQQRILQLCARMCGVSVDDFNLGVDGCGIPVFATPLRNAALAFSRLATLEDIDERDARALRTVRNAMIAFPEYVAGTGEFDSALMRTARGRIVAKSGAEGVHGLADLRTGTGLVLKVVDGAARACAPAALAIVRKLGLLEPSALAELEGFARQPISNRAGRRVGWVSDLATFEWSSNDRVEAPEMPASYDLLERQVRELLSGESDFVASAANFAAFAYHELPEVNWAGFYLLADSGELVLGPFGGKPACTRLPSGQGVCATAVARRKTVVVDDVRAFADHIACDSASRSEIVVPLWFGDQLIGVFDVDSPLVGRFTQADRDGIEALVRAFSDVVGASAARRSSAVEAVAARSDDPSPSPSALGA